MKALERLTIAAKLNLALGSGIVFSAALSIFLLSSLFRLDTDYVAILDGEVRQQRRALEMQVTFKKQVQEWKNILLRGEVAADRSKYRAQFLADRARVLALADTLGAAATSAEVRERIIGFQESFRSIDVAYERAFAQFEASGGSDFRAVDRLVRGQDRAPTDLIDGIVADLQREVERGVARQHAAIRIRRTMALAGLGVLLLVLAAIPLVLNRILIRPVRRIEEASARLADGDLSVEVAHHSGDELGDLAESFREMTRSLRTLLAGVDEGATTVHRASTSMAEGTEQVSASMLEVSRAAQAIAQAATLQTSAVTRTRDTTQVLTARAHDIARDAQAADGAARAVELRTAAGRESAAAAFARLGEIEDATRESGAALDELTLRTRDIRKFTEAVAGIATQSKLLSLNASIEAARAGEHGRGFGVVANEVGKLARDSQEALTSIRDLMAEVDEAGVRISERVARVHHAVREGMTAFRASDEALLAIDVEARHSTDAVARIGTSTRDQQALADTLTEEMEAVAAAAYENAATAEELSASNEEQAAALQQILAGAHELSGLSSRLQASVHRFTL